MDATPKTNETYERLERALDQVVALESRNKEVEHSLRKEQLKADTLYKFLSTFLCEFEGHFAAEDEAPSWEIAQDYVDAATYCAHHFDRRENMVRQVETWMFNQVIPGT